MQSQASEENTIRSKSPLKAERAKSPVKVDRTKSPTRKDNKEESERKTNGTRDKSPLKRRVKESEIKLEKKSKDDSEPEKVKKPTKVEEPEKIEEPERVKKISKPGGNDDSETSKKTTKAEKPLNDKVPKTEAKEVEAALVQQQPQVELKVPKQASSEKLPENFNFTHSLIADINKDIERIVATAVSARVLQLAKSLNVDPETLRTLLELPVLTKPAEPEKKTSPKETSKESTKESPAKEIPKSFKKIASDTVVIVTNYRPKKDPKAKSQSIAVFGVGATTKNKAVLNKLGFSFANKLTFASGEAPGWYAPKDKLTELVEKLKKLKVKIVKKTQEQLVEQEEEEESDEESEVDDSEIDDSDEDEDEDDDD